MTAPRTSDDTHYDAIVVGSGFGGSVMTYRLAEAGRRVLLLERGRPHPPGSFPRSPYQLRRAFWDPSEGLYGMFSIWSFDRLGAVVSSGLGGGSLIYANVLMRKDPEWFVQGNGAGGAEHWPLKREDLEPHYDRAERMLGVQPFPFEHEPYASTPRTRVVHQAARELGWEPFSPPLGVTFAAPDRPPKPGELIPEPEGRPNLHGVTRTTCRLVGECDIGCNYGAKNTLDLNYLSEATHEKAEIRSLHEVREFEPRPGGGYVVRYVAHDRSREGTPFPTSTLPLSEVTCDRLILSAGTLGTTYLLLRNRTRLPGLSAALGTRFSGNGDLLTMALRPRDRATGRPLPVEGGVGTSITTAVRFEGESDPDDPPGSPGRGFYLEDAGYPDMVNWMIQAVEMPGNLYRAWSVLVRLASRFLRISHDTDVAAELSRLLGDASLSAGILPLLGMGREVPNGQIRLQGDRLAVDWSIARSSRYFADVRRRQAELAAAMGAEFRDNPIWHLGRRVITVHPLGGSPMGRDEREGVVDAWGRVFGQPGLYVADGAVMPGTVGPNPSLTIAALADRFADGILAEGGGPARAAA